MNSKSLKIIISFIIATIFIMMCSGKVEARSLSEIDNVNQTVNLSINNLTSNNNLYCVDHGGSLNSTSVKYTVQYLVKIDGNTSWKKKAGWTGYSSAYNSVLNGQMAYILHQKQGYGNSSGAYTSAQRVLYNISNKWFDFMNMDYLKESANISVDMTSGAKSLLAKAKTYANKVKSGASISDKTDTDNIKISMYNDTYIKIDNFKWSFDGDISKIKVYNQDNKVIDSDYIKFYQNKEIVSASSITSGKTFSILINVKAGATKITKIDVSVKYDKITATLAVLRHGSNQTLIYAKTDKDAGETTETFTVNIPLTIKIVINKTDKDTGKAIKGVGFKLKNSTTGEYVVKEDGKISYVQEFEDGTTFATNKKGVITVSGLKMAASYIAIETVAPNIYEVKDNSNVKISMSGLKKVNGTWQVTKDITNKQKYVDLSGYVWEDMLSGKTSSRNDYYKKDTVENGETTYDDSNDKSFEDAITIRLKDSNGNIIKNADGTKCTTSKLSEVYEEVEATGYRFTRVPIDKLKGAYVEFEYNGFTYQSVIAHTDADNGSKATDKTSRETLDGKFASVDGNGTQKLNINDGITATYNDTTNYVSTLNNITGCEVTANTKDTGFDIKSKFSYGTTEIKYINLGLYKKDQADLELGKDLYNVEVSVNGYSHVYAGKQKMSTVKEGDNYESNIGVSFKANFGGTYKAPIYRSDLEFTNDDKDKELKVYLTYAILLGNASSIYDAKVNSIIDHYDSKYEINSIGTGVNESDNLITGNISKYSNGSETNGFKELTINTDVTLGVSQSKYIYVKFEIPKDKVWEVISEGEPTQKDKALYNYAEINSYSLYYKGTNNTVAALDEDSVPENAKMVEVETFEDDTDAAPPVQLVITDAREINGTVFEDNATSSGQGNVKQGDGTLQEGENKIEGVTVTLCDENGESATITKTDKDGNVTNETFNATTDENGNFSISGYIPGKYTLKYTWGDLDHPVQTWKATIYNDPSRMSNELWYQDNVETRYSDAIDNYATRSEIDKEVADKYSNILTANQISEIYGTNTNQVITKMDSTTPTMNFEVEQDKTIACQTGTMNVKFIVQNVDFGIIERAKQSMNLKKEVSHIKITLANGQAIVDADVEEKVENGKNVIVLSGGTTNLSKADPTDGFRGWIKAEIDSELLEGSNLEVTYKITATNTSELDYMNEEFYNYGTTRTNVVTLKPSGMLDFLDNKLVFNDTNWATDDSIKATDRNTLKYNSDIEELEPGDSTSINLTATKKIGSSDELTFYNDVGITKISKTIIEGQSLGAPLTGLPEDNAENGETVKTSTIQFPTDSEDPPPTTDAPPIIITPSTGGNKSYVMPITVGITALVVLGVGIVLIKKRVIDR